MNDPSKDPIGEYETRKVTIELTGGKVATVTLPRFLSETDHRQLAKFIRGLGKARRVAVKMR